MSLFIIILKVYGICKKKIRGTTNQWEDVKEELQGISVASLPAKTEYKTGETLDTAGLTLLLITNKGEKTADSGFTCSPTQLDKAGSINTNTRQNGLV